MDFVKTVKDIMDKRYADVKKNVNAELKDRSSSEVESLKKEVMADTFTKSDTENKEVEQKQDYMDSRKIANDIVNKRFSKARDAIREELVNRIVTKVESMTPEVINEKLNLTKKAKLALGIGLGGAAATIGAVKAGKKIAKFFGATSRDARAKAKKQKKAMLEKI